MKYLRKHNDYLFEIITYRADIMDDINDIKTMLGDTSDDLDLFVRVIPLNNFADISILIKEINHPRKYSNSSSISYPLTWGSVKNNIYQVLDAISDKYNLRKIVLEPRVPSTRGIILSSQPYEIYSIKDLKKSDGTIKDDTSFYEIEIYLSHK